jgi:DMSO/TMAO reductase YedYZ heme-binding membrane subunit
MKDVPVAGPRLPIAYGFFVAGLSAAVMTTLEPGPEEVRAMIRMTAFTSAVPFLFVFAASPLHRLRPSPLSRWLMASRRYLGLSVAASHFWHLVAIVTFLRLYSAEGSVATTTIVFGSAGFVLLGLMAATSTDAAQRALGRGWGVLHTTGLYVVWLDFTFTYMGTATSAPFHALMTLAFAGVFVLRMLAWSARRAAVRA